METNSKKVQKLEATTPSICDVLGLTPDDLALCGMATTEKITT